MRSPHAWGIAVRKSSGEIVSHAAPLERPSEKHKWMGWPVIRGLVTLGLAMGLGFRALRFSTNVVLEEISGEKEKKVEISGWMAAIHIIISLAFFIFFYVMLRSTIPRFRYDQLMKFGWKVLLPISLANILVTSFIVAIS